MERFGLEKGNGKYAIILRHAERDPIEHMGNALTPLLTERGKAESFELGMALSALGPVTTFHSPVPRCQQTAVEIARGINEGKGSARDGGQITGLGGPYIAGDWLQLADTVQRMGQERFIRTWFDGGFPPDWIMPLPDAAGTQSRILIDQLKGLEGSAINVTHDWNIMIIREHYFGLRHEDIGEPGFLDGLSALLKDGSVILRYRGRIAEIPAV